MTETERRVSTLSVSVLFGFDPAIADDLCGGLARADETVVIWNGGKGGETFHLKDWWLKTMEGSEVCAVPPILVIGGTRDEPSYAANFILELARNRPDARLSVRTVIPEHLSFGARTGIKFRVSKFVSRLEAAGIANLSFE